MQLQFEIGLEGARYLICKIFGQLNVKKIFAYLSIQVQIILGEQVVDAHADHFGIARFGHFKQLIQILRVADLKIGRLEILCEQTN